MITVPVSNGELVDKITILRLKRERISDPRRLENVVRELSLLEDVMAAQLPSSPGLTQLTVELARVNGSLWEVEDALRECEAAGRFDEAFVALARAVYQTNDQRNRLKRSIDHLTGSALTEEKSYAENIVAAPSRPST